MGRFLELRLDSFQPEFPYGTNINLTGAVPERTEHFSSVAFAEHHALAEIIRKAWVPLNEESVYDSAIVCDDVPNIHAE